MKKMTEFDYSYAMNLKPCKKYRFADQVYRIRNKSAATIIADRHYADALKAAKQMQKISETEGAAEDNAEEIMELSAQMHEDVVAGITVLLGKEAAEYIVEYENAEGAGLGDEDLFALFGDVYVIAKGGDPAATAEDFPAGTQKPDAVG